MARQPANTAKNLWVAASDGDIDRVRELIEGGMSPNDKDSNHYTPMHAAASYHHFDLLLYLISAGGDINIKDDEGETPLFTVESVEAARWLVEHGADPSIENNEGEVAADFLAEDQPEVSQYLYSLSSGGGAVDSAGPVNGNGQTSANDGPETDQSDARIDALADARAEELMEEAQRAMQAAAERGEDPEAVLREIVERAMREGQVAGGELDQAEADRKRTRH